MKRLLKFLRKKKDKDLSLLHVHTFQTGEKLYTYRAEDMHHIQYRHYQTISEIQASLQAFGQLPFEWQIALKELREVATDAIDNQGKRTEALIHIVKYLDHFKERAKGIRDTNVILEDEMLGMFFILEGENPKVYDKHFIEKKKQLFALEPEMRSFFLSKLPTVSEVFKTISLIDLQELFSEMATVKNIYQSLS